MPSSKNNIPGLSLLSEWISAESSENLLALIDNQHWRDDLRRRVQHYGFRYDYRARVVTREMDLGPLPEWLVGLAVQVGAVAGFERRPDQIIINEYLPGQGISPHVDCRPCFGPTIASLSFGGSADIVFQKQGQPKKRTVRLDPRSLLVMTGSARQDWRHSIPARKNDLIDGVRVPRTRRVSLTFRTVKLKSV